MNSCPLCHNRATSQLKLPHTVVWECRGNDCSLQFAFPQMEERNLARAYSTCYYPSTDSSHPVMYDGTSEIVVRSILSQLEGCLGPLKGSSLLDYGCGRGLLLRIAREFGLAPVGIEPDPVARIITAAHVGMTAYANIDDLRSQDPAAQFDLIILWDVIEHLRQPWLDLREMRGLLSPGGRLLVSTMNVECLRALFERERWMNYENPTHLYYFGRRSLERVLVSAGFLGVHEWKPKICYPHHGTMRRWLYEASSLFGVSDGLYYLCSVEGDVSSQSQLSRSRSEATVQVDVNAAA